MNPNATQAEEAINDIELKARAFELRLRIMDLETGLSNFEDNESGIGAGLRRIAQETP